MNNGFKAVGVNPGDVPFRLGNCLELRRSPNFVQTPLMYAKVRGSAMGWMSSIEAIRELRFRDELFSSDIVLAHDWHESGSRGDSSEGAILVAALLIAFPDGQFGFGLQGGTGSLSGIGDYRSLGTHSVHLPNGGEDRALVTKMFDYLRANSYWVDDDLVRVLAPLTDVCQDRDRIVRDSVLSHSTSGNHLVDPGAFHAYQLVEALLEVAGRSRSIAPRPVAGAYSTPRRSNSSGVSGTRAFTSSREERRRACKTPESHWGSTGTVPWNVKSESTACRSSCARPHGRMCCTALGTASSGTPFNWRHRRGCSRASTHSVAGLLQHESRISGRTVAGSVQGLCRATGNSTGAGTASIGNADVARDGDHRP